MEKNNLFTKVLVIAGNVLVWTPLILPFIFAIFALAQLGRVVFDFLLPAELFPFVLIGIILLMWGAFRVKRQIKWIGLHAMGAFFMLIAGQVVANVSGLAHGELGRESAVWYIAFGCIVLFDIGLAVSGLGGLRLLRDLIRDFKQQQEEAKAAEMDWDDDSEDDYEIVEDDADKSDSFEDSDDSEDFDDTEDSAISEAPDESGKKPE